MKPKPPKSLIMAPVSQTYSGDIALKEGDKYEASQFEGAVMTGQFKGSLSIESSILVRVDMAKTQLKSLELLDIQMEQGLLFGAYWAGAIMQRVLFKHCMMSGMVLSECGIKDVVFEDCKIDLVNFRFAKFSRVVFRRCLLGEADFQGAEMDNVVMEECNLNGADISNAKFTQVDLRGSALGSIKGALALKGVEISSAQLISLAPVLAAEAGIVVRDY